MKRITFKLLLVSLISGLLITYLFTGQMNWKQYGDCSHTQIRTAYFSNVKKVRCSGLEYGFPYKFIAANPNISLTSMAPDDSNQQIELATASIVDFNISKFLANVV